MDAECFQPHQVLGDAVQYHRYVEQQQQLEQDQQQQDGPNDAAGGSGIASMDASTVNPDVWAAACLLGDKGVQLIEIYRELEACREVAVQQMTLNSSMRTLTQQQQQQQQQQQHYRPSPGGGSAVGQLLSKATVMDAIKQSHDGRVMTAWEAQQAVWAQQAAHLSAVAAKHPAQLAITSAGEDWRNKQELLSALEVAVPAAAAAVQTRSRGAIGLDGSNADGMDGGKGSIGDGGPVGSVACAGGNWMSSLRNANERLLQIGNIFSGLYLSVRNTSTVAAAGLTAIRKPDEAAFEAHVPGSGLSSTGGTKDPAGGSSTGSSDGGTASLSGARAGAGAGAGLYITSQRAKWSQEAYLQDKLKAGAAAVKVVQTHSPDTSQLGVRGWSIEAALACSPLTHTPVSLADVERRLAVADPPLWQEYQAAQQREASKAAVAAAGAQQAAKRAAARAAAQQLPRPGPHLEASDTQLCMHYTIPSHSDPTCPHVAFTPREPPSWAASCGCSDSQLGDQQQPGATGAVAKFTLVSTGTAAVFYSWVRQGRRRLPVATAVASDAADAAGGLDGKGAPCTTAAASAAASGGGSGALFTMPDLQGVILPGESKTFRFSFSSPTPCIIHEAWACFTHPPLEPLADRSRRRGEPLALDLKGVAVADGDTGGPGLVAAAQLTARLEAKTRDAQAKAVLATILSSVQQQVAGSTHSSSSSLPAGYDPVLAARWAAANPPGSCGCGSSSSGNNSNSSSSSKQQAAGDAAPDGTQQAPGPAVPGAAAAHDAAGAPHDAPARDNTLCVHFYSPTTHALLSHVYSQAHALLQPTPPAPVDPPKKGASVHPPGAGPAKKAAANNSKEATAAVSGPDAAEPLLPPTWDPPSIAGLRGLLARLAAAGPPGSAHRQAAAVLGQQLEVALQGAAVPPCRTQLVEAAARRTLLGLADAVEEACVSAAHHAQAAPSTEASSSTGSRTHRGPRTTGHDNRHGSAVGAPAGAGAGAAAAQRGGGRGVHSGGVGDAAAAAAAAAAPRTQQEGAALQQVLSDAVWGEVGQALTGFEGVLQEEEAAAAAAVGSNAARWGDAADYEGVAWRQFAAARTKQQLGLV